MKLIGVTQRVDLAPHYKETRDALDQRWSHFLYALNYVPYPMPNCLKLLPSILSLPFKGFLFTGGNHLHDDAIQRDQLENALLEHCLRHKMPLIGVCRGMQLILEYFGSALETVKNHVSLSHTVEFNKRLIRVNSYHKYGTLEVKPPLKAVGLADDGVIEAVQHTTLPIYGVMWHPERNFPYLAEDQTLFKTTFG